EVRHRRGGADGRGEDEGERRERPDEDAIAKAKLADGENEAHERGDPRCGAERRYGDEEHACVVTSVRRAEVRDRGEQRSQRDAGGDDAGGVAVDPLPQHAAARYDRAAARKDEREVEEQRREVDARRGKGEGAGDVAEQGTL